MQIEVISKINYIKEEFALLSSLARSDGYPEGLLRFRKNIESKGQPESLIHRLEVVGNILEEGARAFKKDMDAVNEYFKCSSESAMCLAAAIILPSPWDFDVRAHRLPDYVRSQSFEDRCRRFICTCSGTFDTDAPAQKGGSEGLWQVSQWLEQSPLLPEEKWKLFSGFTNFESHLEPLTRLMKKAEAVLEKTKAQWEPLIDSFYKYWSRQCAQRDVIGDIKSIFHIDLKSGEQPHPLCLSPLLITMNTLSFTVDDEWSHNGWEMYALGLIYSEDVYLDYQFHTPGDDELLLNTAVRQLKLLSDKSKLEILRSIREKPAYGAQLARQMNLTTATISYHLNALIQEQLVNLERDNHRIYYSINQKTIQELVDYLNKELL